MKLYDTLNEYDIGSKSTETKGKREVEEKIYKSFKTKCLPNQIIIGLVGQVYSSNDPLLKRHIDNYTKLSCQEKNMVFVERNFDIANQLELFTQIKHPDIKVRGPERIPRNKENPGAKEYIEKTIDMKKVIDQYIAGKADIYLIDYDGVENFNSEHKQLIDDFYKKKIADYLILVFSPRGKTTKDLLTKMSDEEKLPRVGDVAKSYLKRPKYIYDPATQKSTKYDPKAILPADKLLEQYILKKYSVSPLIAENYIGVGSDDINEEIKGTVVIPKNSTIYWAVWKNQEYWQKHIDNMKDLKKVVISKIVKEAKERSDDKWSGIFVDNIEDTTLSELISELRNMTKDYRPPNRDDHYARPYRYEIKKDPAIGKPKIEKQLVTDVKKEPKKKGGFQ